MRLMLHTVFKTGWYNVSARTESLQNISKYWDDKKYKSQNWDYLKLPEDTKFLFIVFLPMIPGYSTWRPIQLNHRVSTTMLLSSCKCTICVHLRVRLQIVTFKIRSIWGVLLWRYPCTWNHVHTVMILLNYFWVIWYKWYIIYSLCITIMQN